VSQLRRALAALLPPPRPAPEPPPTVDYGGDGGGGGGEGGGVVHWSPASGGAVFQFPDGSRVHVGWEDWADYMSELIAEGYDLENLYEAS